VCLYVEDDHVDTTVAASAELVQFTDKYLDTDERLDQQREYSTRDQLQSSLGYTPIRLAV